MSRKELVIFTRIPTSRKVVPSQTQRELAFSDVLSRMARGIIAANEALNRDMTYADLGVIKGREIDLGPAKVTHKATQVSEQGGLCSWCISNPGGCDVPTPMTAATEIGG